MYEPKIVDAVTLNGKHILIYEDLEYEHLVMLANDLVVGICPKTDRVEFLTLDEKGVYVDIMTTLTSKPTALNAELVLDIRKVWKISSLGKGKHIQDDFRRIGHSEIETLEFHYQNPRES